MNQLNAVFQSNQKSGTKLLTLRLEQQALRDIDLHQVSELLHTSGIEAISLICTGSIQECLDLAKQFAKMEGIPVILETDFHKVFRMGTAAFAKAAAESCVSAVRIPNLPFEEQGQLAVYMLDEEGPFLVREITPASGDRIVQNMQFARGFIWCSNQGSIDFLSGLPGDPYMFYLYAAEAAATQPVMLEFGSRNREELEAYLDLADGAIIGDDLAEDFRSNGFSMEALETYCQKF